MHNIGPLRERVVERCRAVQGYPGHFLGSREPGGQLEFEAAELGCGHFLRNTAANVTTTH